MARYVLYTFVASLMFLVKTPPPSLRRARFATVLEHLPSVPSVVLPFEPDQKWSGFPLFYARIYRYINKRRDLVNLNCIACVCVSAFVQTDRAGLYKPVK